MNGLAVVLLILAAIAGPAWVAWERLEDERLRPDERQRRSLDALGRATDRANSRPWRETNDG